MKAHSILELFFFCLVEGGESRLGEVNCKRGDEYGKEINLIIFTISLKTQSCFLTYHEMNSATACEYLHRILFYMYVLFTEILIA